MRSARYTLFSTVATLGVISCLFAVGCTLRAHIVQPPEHPNVILVLTDDLDSRLLEEHPADYPNIQKLAAGGTSFENAFVTDPLCCPSRATILRGQYAHNHEILGNSWPRGGSQKFRSLGREESTVATWLQEDDYRTIFLGKYMNGYYGTRVPPGWDEWHAISGNYLSNDLNENGRIRYYDPERYHLDDVLAKKAADYIYHAKNEGPPFFMWLGTKSPHTPASPAPRHTGAFADEPLPKPPSFDEDDVSDKPDWVADNPAISEEDAENMEKLYRDRLASMLAVDDMVGRLLSALEKSGELDNTYVFFTSDNGFHLGQHRLTKGKWTAYDEDTRVPLIVRGPGVPAGQTREHLILNNDLAPTFADLAGTRTPPFVDGRSLLPLLSESPPPKDNWRRFFLVEAAAGGVRRPPSPSADESSLKPLLTGDPLPNGWRRSVRSGAWTGEDWGRPGLEAVRTADSLYVRYETGEIELYDVSEDPYQLDNLHESADPALLHRMEGVLEELRACAGASCRTAEDGH